MNRASMMSHPSMMMYPRDPSEMIRTRAIREMINCRVPVKATILDLMEKIKSLFVKIKAFY
jgi:hypothetical protein